MRLVTPCCALCGKPEPKLTKVRLGIGRRYGAIQLCARCVATLRPYLDLIAAPVPVTQVVTDPAEVIARRRPIR